MAANQPRRGWLIGIIIIAIFAIFIGISYNGLVKKDENVKLQWGNLQNAYQRRLDLIPNLVSVVKASSDYEKTTLVQLAEARARAQQVSVSSTDGANPNSYDTQEKVQGEMTNSINKVIAIVEKYPDLKSTKNYLDFQEQLVGTERRIKVSRNDFNASIAQYNRSVRGFPTSIVASIFRFKTKEGFKSDAGSDTSPEIKFSK